MNCSVSNLPILLNEFNSLLRQTGVNISRKNYFAVAVSGGCDSLALVFLINDWIREYGGDLMALTIDHQLRSESTQEALWVQTLLKHHKIPHTILTWEGQKPLTRRQEKARQARYDLLQNWCWNQGASYLLTAHHFSDQAETFFLRLRQGSGLLGLAGMRPLTQGQGYQILRPFLGISKERLKKTLDQRQVQWQEDPSNENVTYERVFWRKKGVETHVSSFLIEKLQSLRAAFEEWTKRFLQLFSKHSPLGYLLLKKDPFLRLPFTFQEVLLSYIIRALGVGAYPPSTKILHLLTHSLRSQDFKAITAHGLRFSSYGLFFLIAREHKRVKDVLLLDSTGPDRKLWDKRFFVQGTKGLTGSIKTLGEKGWEVLLKNYPALKALKLPPRPVLWATPALWQGESLDLKKNMVVEYFRLSKIENKQKMYVFSLKYPFQALFFE